MPKPFYLSLEGAARLLRMPSRQLAALVRLRQIPHTVLPGGQLLFDETRLVDWADRLNVEPEPSCRTLARAPLAR